MTTDASAHDWPGMWRGIAVVVNQVASTPGLPEALWDEHSELVTRLVTAMTELSLAVHREGGSA